MGNTTATALFKKIRHKVVFNRAHRLNRRGEGIGPRKKQPVHSTKKIVSTFTRITFTE